MDSGAVRVGEVLDLYPAAPGAGDHDGVTDELGGGDRFHPASVLGTRLGGLLAGAQISDPYAGVEAASDGDRSTVDDSGGNGRHPTGTAYRHTNLCAGGPGPRPVRWRQRWR